MRGKVIYLLLAFNFAFILLVFVGQIYLLSFHQRNDNPKTTLVQTDVPKLVERVVKTVENHYPAKVTFVGDIMLGRHVEYLMTQNGADYPFRNLDFLKGVDNYVVGNFEGSVPLVHQKTKNFGFSFSINKVYLSELSAVGFTHLSLANNHALDFGVSGLVNTVTELTNNNLIPFGQPGVYASSSVTILPVEAGRVSLIGIETVSGFPTVAELSEMMNQAKQQSDWQVIYIHWGSEYQALPNGQEVALAKQLVTAGADLIIGHHPHVIQSVSEIEGVPVFYSLGNFIFDQYFSEEVQMGLALEVAFNKGGLQIELWPVTSLGSQAKPSLVIGEDKELFLSKLANISDPGLATMIKSGVVSSQILLASSTEIAIMEQ